MEDCLFCKIIKYELIPFYYLTTPNWIVFESDKDFGDEIIIVYRKHGIPLTKDMKLDVINIAKFLCPDYDIRNIVWKREEHFHAIFCGMKELLRDKEQWV